MELPSSVTEALESDPKMELIKWDTFPDISDVSDVQKIRKIRVDMSRKIVDLVEDMGYAAHR